MAYLARRKMKLVGKDFAPGDLIPQHVIDRIDPNRLASMRRVGVVLEGTPAQISDALKPVLGEGEEMCDICGGGPYKALAQHVTKMHSEQAPEPPAETAEQES